MRRRRPVDERFWEKVEGGDFTTCWIWTANKINTGYGQFFIDGRPFLAHRYAWMNLRGEIPEGLVLDHLCRVRACVNPWHLEPVTMRENNLRAVKIFGANRHFETHCKHGHEFTEENTRIHPEHPTWRICKPCGRRRVATLRAKKKAMA